MGHGAPRHLGRSADPAEPKKRGVSSALIDHDLVWAAGVAEPWRPIKRENGDIRRRWRIPKWRATVDEDGHYSFAVAL